MCSQIGLKKAFTFNLEACVQNIRIEKITFILLTRNKLCNCLKAREMSKMFLQSKISFWNCLHRTWWLTCTSRKRGDWRRSWEKVMSPVEWCPGATSWKWGFLSGDFSRASCSKGEGVHGGAMVEVDQSLLQLQSVSWWRRWSWWGRGSSGSS